MKIYFGGSIRGGRIDQQLYQELIDYLRRYGEVLSEHVGDPSVTHLGSKGTTKEIYRSDMVMLQESDTAVIEVTTPSIGVGYEIAKAEESKKVLCLYRPSENVSLSAMVAGNPNITLKEYRNVEEAIAHIDNFFAELKRL